MADFAHNLECAYFHRRGQSTLGLGYNCTNGREATKAYLHSYVPLAGYRGGHVAPVFKVVRHGPGIAVPSRYITVADTQPWR